MRIQIYPALTAEFEKSFINRYYAGLVRFAAAFDYRFTFLALIMSVYPDEHNLTAAVRTYKPAVVRFLPGFSFFFLF